MGLGDKAEAWHHVAGRVKVSEERPFSHWGRTTPAAVENPTDWRHLTRTVEVRGGAVLRLGNKSCAVEEKGRGQAA